MTAAPLATTDDLEARLGRDLTTSEAARAPALLADAGAKVRSFTGNQFALVEEDLVNLHTRGGRIKLPKAPVVAVASVATTDGVALATNLWTWDGLDLITVDQCALAPVMQVVYSHGSAEVPETVLAKVCEMVLRVLAAPSATDGLSAETIGQYSYQAAGGSQGVAVRLTDGDRKDLREAGYGPPAAGSITLRAW